MKSRRDDKYCSNGNNVRRKAIQSVDIKIRWNQNPKQKRNPVGMEHLQITFNHNRKQMANTYHQIYIQAVFAVKYRNAIIDKEWRSVIQGVIGNLINETGCKTIIVNGIEDHIHCFFGLKPTVAVSELMKTVKAKSSKYINDHHLTNERFEWQEGYGAFSYSHSQIDSVYHYITNQEEHHDKQDFREEYLEYLNKFEISFDEQYIFDELI